MDLRRVLRSPHRDLWCVQNRGGRCAGDGQVDEMGADLVGKQVCVVTLRPHRGGILDWLNTRSRRKGAAEGGDVSVVAHCPMLAGSGAASLGRCRMNYARMHQ